MPGMCKYSDIRAVMLLAIGISSLTGCAARRAHQTSAEPSAAHAAIYVLSDLQWQRALYYKPGGAVSDLDPYLAPLIVQEVRPAGRLGRVGLDAAGRLVVDPRQPTVYFSRSQCLLDGRDYEQLLFVWFHAAAAAATNSPGLPVQGVRMTFNAQGQPVVWEVLASAEPTRLLFAVNSLEALARQQFGGPLPGRKYSLETELADEPSAVVARVLSDGPVPMGPIVHLLADGTIGTLTCRCMPSQVEDFAETISYELVPIEQLVNLYPHPLHWIANQHHTTIHLAFTLDCSSDLTCLSDVLRLPAGF